MPPYSGPQFKVLLRARRPNAMVEPTTVSARDWESSVVRGKLPQYPDHDILGRIRNLDVELFAHYPNLRSELEGLDYTVRPFDATKCMSIYTDTEFKNRTVVQKLQDQLYAVLREEQGEDIGYALIAATQSEWVLVCKLDRERYNAQNPCPPELTSHEVTYPTIGYVLDNDVSITAPEKDVKRFYLDKHPWVVSKFIDRTVKVDIERAKQLEKEEKVREHKREKRRAKKKAAREGTAVPTEREGSDVEGKWYIKE